jgi:hypothetical protein
MAKDDCSSVAALALSGMSLSAESAIHVGMEIVYLRSWVAYGTQGKSFVVGGLLSATDSRWRGLLRGVTVLPQLCEATQAIELLSRILRGEKCIQILGFISNFKENPTHNLTAPTQGNCELSSFNNIAHRGRVILLSFIRGITITTRVNITSINASSRV